LTVIIFPAVAAAVFGPLVETLRVTAAALSAVPVPFAPLYVIIRKLSRPTGAPMLSAHVTVVPLSLHVGGAALKICDVPPLTLTVIDEVSDEIVFGLRTALATIARALELAPARALELELAPVLAYETFI
jgi:hypothetical protein